jgi:type IV pilus assembly protein PilE
MNHSYLALRASRGFTMIELIIVVAIVGILAAVAIPVYSQYMTQTRRVDAIAFLEEVAGEQAQFFSNNNRYAADLEELGYGAAATFDSVKGYYTISSAYPNAPSTSSFLLTATPVSGELQDSDTDCASLTLSSNGVKQATGPLGKDCW